MSFESPTARILTHILSTFEDELGSTTLIRLLKIYINSIEPPAPAPAPAPTNTIVNPKSPSPAPAPKKEKICPMCHDPVPAPSGCIAGGDGSHRMCIVRFGSMSGWYDAVGIGNNKYEDSHSEDSDHSEPSPIASMSPSNTAPSSPIRTDITAPSTPPRMNLTSEVPGAPKKVKIERSGIVEKPKKASKRCEARVLGEKSVIPNTKNTLCYKSAQCETMTTHSVKLDDDSVMPICADCLSHYLARNETPKGWHGFFDDGNIPATSHIIGGSWHTKKVADAAKKSNT